MARFLIEVPHEANERDCILAAKVLISSGSQFLSNADFGCLDGEHKAWVIIDVDSRQEARLLVPAAFRHVAKVVQLNKFSLDELDDALKRHPG
jgi:hypothetical protein